MRAGRFVLSAILVAVTVVPAFAQGNGPRTIAPSGPNDTGRKGQPVVNDTTNDAPIELAFGRNEFECHEGIPLIVEVVGNGGSALITYDVGAPVPVSLLLDIDGTKFSNGAQSVQVDPDRIIYEDQDYRDDCFLPGSTSNNTGEGFIADTEEPEADFGRNDLFAMEFPLAAKTGGGIVRSGPGMDFGKVTSLAEYADVTVLEPTGVDMNGYPWFKIGYRGGREGFMWGGIICSIEVMREGTYGLCP